METVLMEADSTSGGGASAADAPRHTVAGEGLAKQPRNIEFYDTHILANTVAGREEQLMLWLQRRGLIPAEMRCASARADCRPALRGNSRAADKLSWHCEGCGRSRPARTRSFFSNINCSLPSVLKILLAWSEDLHHEAVAQRLGVKVQDTLAVYERVEAAAAEAAARGRLRGVVLADMYPACLTHRSPDSSDTHHHRVLMLADTTSVPTRYYLHVMSGNKKADSKSSRKGGDAAEVAAVCARVCERGSTLVTGAAVPAVRVPGLARVLPLHSLTQRADSDMTCFLRERIWRQALVLCSAARETCGAAPGRRCGAGVQRYLHAALHRLRHDADGYYPHVLALLARHYTR